MIDRMRERAIGAGYSAGWSVIKAMPRGMSERAFRAAADAATVRNGGGARQLRKNLRRVVGPTMSELRMDTLVGEALRSYSRYWLETFRLETMNHAEVAARTVVTAPESALIDAALDRGKGVVFALPHSGNWDAAGIWVVARYGRFATVAERLKPESVFDRFVAYRESLGMEVIALTGGQQAPTEVLSQRLRANGIVCLLADRDLSHSGIEVSFFGEPARMPPGPALLAATTGATLIAAHPRFEGDAWGVDFSAPVELPEGHLRERVTSATQQLADLFAARIAKYPTDWHMLQRLWLADLPPRPGRPVDAAARSGG
jgi:lauroyl/myristoyl acyltransferase